MEEKVILILHGWGSSAKSWSAIKEMLENNGLKVFLPDLPGFGQSFSLKKPWSVQDYANWVKDYCRKNNLSSFFLMGHSFGGAVAFQYALFFPSDIKKLLLVSPALIRIRDRKKEALVKIAKFYNRFSFLPFHSLVKRAIYRFFLHSDYPLTQNSLRETYLKAIKQDFSDQLSNVAVPTVFIWGDKDKITPFKFAKFVKEKTPRSELKVLRGVGHVPRVEAPELFIKTILESL